MSSFVNSVSLMPVNAGQIGIFWLGQAGFLFKLADGRLVVVDPYFSDCCNRLVNFKRLMPYLMGATDLEYDIYIASHAHPDHFDVDVIGAVTACPKTELICAYDCKAECERIGIKDRVIYIKEGDALCRNGLTIKAVMCDHGEGTPDAVGLILENEGKRVYLMGDTCYRKEFLENEELKGCDVLILPINGAFGNLNEREAADVAEGLKPVLTVPCHFWNFAEHGGNPELFAKAMQEKGLPYNIFRMGEGVVI